MNDEIEFSEQQQYEESKRNSDTEIINSIDKKINEIINSNDFMNKNKNKNETIPNPTTSNEIINFDDEVPNEILEKELIDFEKELVNSQKSNDSNESDVVNKETENIETHLYDYEKNLKSDNEISNIENSNDSNESDIEIQQQSNNEKISPIAQPSTTKTVNGVREGIKSYY